MSADKRCNQCWKVKPLADFESTRHAGRYLQDCRVCRAKYNTWHSLSIDEKRAHMRASAKPRNGIGFMAELVLTSKNRKTGPIPVSMTDEASCPDACSLKSQGCYAESGKTRYHWDRVATKRGMSWKGFCERVKLLPRGQLWRHNEAGDLPGRGDQLDVHALRMLVEANRGRRGFTFTHKPMRSRRERESVRFANASGFTVNLSADSLERADALAALNIAPVVVVIPHDVKETDLATPQGRRVIVCLNEWRGLTCVECRLCSNAQRRSIVAFRAHGQAKAIVSEIVRSRRVPNVEVESA